METDNTPINPEEEGVDRSKLDYVPIDLYLSGTLNYRTIEDRGDRRAVITQDHECVSYELHAHMFDNRDRIAGLTRVFTNYIKQTRE